MWGPRMRRGDDSKWPASLLCATRPTKCGESSEEQQVLRNPIVSAIIAFFFTTARRPARRYPLPQSA